MDDHVRCRETITRAKRCLQSCSRTVWLSQGSAVAAWLFELVITPMMVPPARPGCTAHAGLSLHELTFRAFATVRHLLECDVLGAWHQRRKTRKKEPGWPAESHAPAC